jgi:hypothetical protein
MNTTNLLITSAVIALVATTGAALAQQDRIPQQDRNAPAEKVAPRNAPAVHNQAPNGRVGEPQGRGRTETTGQAPREGQPAGRPQLGAGAWQDRAASKISAGRTQPITGQAPRDDRPDRTKEKLASGVAGTRLISTSHGRSAPE